MRILIAALLLMSLNAQASADERRYDSHGHVVETETRRGDTVTRYDPSGHVRGYDVHENGTIRHYDSRGHFRGHTTLDDDD